MPHRLSSTLRRLIEYQTPMSASPEIAQDWADLLSRVDRLRETEDQIAGLQARADQQASRLSNRMLSLLAARRL